jgi:hypothetical protein
VDLGGTHVVVRANDFAADLVFHKKSDALDVESLCSKGLVEDHHCRYAEQIGVVDSSTSEAKGVVGEINDVGMALSRRLLWQS